MTPQPDTATPQPAAGARHYPQRRTRRRRYRRTRVGDFRTAGVDRRAHDGSEWQAGRRSLAHARFKRCACTPVSVICRRRRTPPPACRRTAAGGRRKPLAMPTGTPAAAPAATAMPAATPTPAATGGASSPSASPQQDDADGDGNGDTLCQTCLAVSVQAPFRICYACKQYPDRIAGECIDCGEKAKPEFARCWHCSQQVA